MKKVRKRPKFVNKKQNIQIIKDNREQNNILDELDEEVNAEER
jgi:hypothetical protein